MSFGTFTGKLLEEWDLDRGGLLDGFTLTFLQLACFCFARNSASHEVYCSDTPADTISYEVFSRWTDLDLWHGVNYERPMTRPRSNNVQDTHPLPDLAGSHADRLRGL